MLKARVMPTLLYKEPGLVKGQSFDSWRRVGSLMQAIKVYNMRKVDELVFLDITATPDGRGPDTELVDDFADECFMPLTVGGGVRTLDDVRGLLRVGADKVAISTAAIESPSLIEQASDRLGAQCVVVSIDARKVGDGRYEVFTHSGREATGRSPEALAQAVEARGAGEVLLTSIDRDGTMEGYDLDLLRRVTQAVSIPVIASGGAGSATHMVEAIQKGGAAAVAAASIFHFTQHTPREIKAAMDEAGIPVRL